MYVLINPAERLRKRMSHRLSVFLALLTRRAVIRTDLANSKKKIAETQRMSVLT